MVFSTQYFPSIFWMQFFLQLQEVTIEQCENYQKQGLMNRCKILGAEGVITLSVPLVGGREQKALVKDLTINNSSRWHTNQQRAIRSCYSKSPFFDYYFEPIEKLLTKKHTYLLDLNMEVLHLLTNWLKWNGQLTYTNSYQGSNLTNLTNPQSLTPNPQSPNYIQVFADRQPFTPSLSVIDLLFCTGPQAQFILMA